MVERIAMFGVLAVGGAMLAQAPPAPPVPPTPPAQKATPSPNGLDELLTQALKNNPDIRVARAKMDEAEAELARVRFQVMQKVVAGRAAVDEQKTIAEIVARRIETLKELRKMARASQDEIGQAEAMQASAKAALARAENDLAALTGRLTDPKADMLMEFNVRLAKDTMFSLGEGTGFQSRMMGGAPQPPAVPGANEKLRAALDTPVKLTEELGEFGVQEAIAMLCERATKGIIVRNGLAPNHAHNVTLPKGELPLGAWLMLVEDSSPDVRIVVREYGLLITPADRTPEGAMPLRGVWPVRKREPAMGSGK